MRQNDAMKDNMSLLKSNYIIDGIRLNATPMAMLDMACEREAALPSDGGSAIVDESVDPNPFTDRLDADNVEEYAALVDNASVRRFDVHHSNELTKMLVAKSLVEKIWIDGHFRLGDLAVELSWNWNQSKVGNMASFYNSVEAACNYLEALGLKMKSYSVSEDERLDVRAVSELSDQPTDYLTEREDEDFFDELPFKTEHPVIKKNRKCPNKAYAKKGDWLIFIPFDTCPLHIGASLLAEVTGLNLGKAVNLESPDYFIDCYEVVRELVEDGIAISGRTVADGGLMTALRKYLPEGRNFNAELGGIMRSYSHYDLTHILFAEIPGVLIEIHDEDYDYVDAELLLQDVAYYPLGTFDGEQGQLSIDASDNSDITTILHSLLTGQVQEGED